MYEVGTSSITGRYSPLFYVPLALLHLSLLLRVGGDLNALVLLLFIGNMVRLLHTDSGRPLVPRSKFAIVGYVLIGTEFLSGIVFASTDLDEGVRRNKRAWQKAVGKRFCCQPKR
ncbi:MAG: hypothetical protein D8M56_11275 [Chloroflexi bacterium]|nr:hypothetical protein [Chloroflexota bacterium]